MSMLQDVDDSNRTTDDKTLRWVGAIALLIAIQAGWMICDAWYLHLAVQRFLLTGALLGDLDAAA